MVKFEYGDPGASIRLLQMVDDHDLAVIENVSRRSFCVVGIVRDGSVLCSCSGVAVGLVSGIC